MKIRKFHTSDTEIICQLFYDTIHNINGVDHSADQLDAWAPKVPDPEVWQARMVENITLVAESSGEITGFGELADGNHIHMLFCHKNHIRKGIGAHVLAALEDEGTAAGQRCFSTFASLTARTFYEMQGYRVIRRRRFRRGGVDLSNWLMEKQI